jgi:hypothetical protein
MNTIHVSNLCNGSNPASCSHIVTFENNEMNEVRKARVGPHELLFYYNAHLSTTLKEHLERKAALVPRPEYLETESTCVSSNK